MQHMCVICVSVDIGKPLTGKTRPQALSPATYSHRLCSCKLHNVCQRGTMSFECLIDLTRRLASQEGERRVGGGGGGGSYVFNDRRQ